MDVVLPKYLPVTFRHWFCFQKRIMNYQESRKEKVIWYAFIGVSLVVVFLFYLLQS